ncbi:MAG: NTP transferase domain-containing protein [Armatimonadota bacterium]
MNDFHAIILAAGRGSRMGVDIPKTLIPLCGKPMISHILDALTELKITTPVIVVGKQHQAFEETLNGEIVYAVQEEQLGSGHAVMCARDLAPSTGYLLVMCGDSPLFRVETIRSLMNAHRTDGSTVTLVSALLDDPFGYGRILRNASGEIIGIAEEKNASPEQKVLREINGGCYAFITQWLWDNIHLLTRNEAGELNLTEMVDIAIRQGLKVSSVTAGPDEVAGVNTPDQLRQAEEILTARGDCTM